MTWHTHIHTRTPHYSSPHDFGPMLRYLRHRALKLFSTCTSSALAQEGRFVEVIHAFRIWYTVYFYGFGKGSGFGWYLILHFDWTCVSSVVVYKRLYRRHILHARRQNALLFIYPITSPLLLGAIESGRWRWREKRKKKSGPSPLYSWRGFLRSSTFFFLVFPMWAAEADTQLAFKASAHSTTCVWFYFPLTLSSTAVTARSVKSYRAETFTQSNESPSATISPPKKPLFWGF